ncbi:hypothetical protein EDB19DRAFT_2008500 [Suillus lakei]|nr:hypothetical protein EDB19DRAFT_2008500 [Suillus lakei]
MPGTSSRRSTSVGPSTSPTSRVASPIYGLNTRRTVRTTTSQESIEQQTNKVKDSLSGKNFLEAKLLCHVDQPFTLNHLISVLFQITQMSSSTPVPVVAAIRAIAFILKDHAASELATLVAKQVTDDVTSKLVDHVIAAISPQVTLIHNASQMLTSTLEGATTLHNSIGRERSEKEDNIKTATDRIEEAADALYESVETYQKALKMLAPSLDATQEKINMLSTQMSKAPSHYGQFRPNNRQGHWPSSNQGQANPPGPQTKLHVIPSRHTDL